MYICVFLCLMWVQVNDKRYLKANKRKSSISHILSKSQVESPNFKRPLHHADRLNKHRYIGVHTIRMYTYVCIRTQTLIENCKYLQEYVASLKLIHQSNRWTQPKYSKLLWERIDARMNAIKWITVNVVNEKANTTTSYIRNWSKSNNNKQLLSRSSITFRFSFREQETAKQLQR